MIEIKSYEIQVRVDNLKPGDVFTNEGATYMRVHVSRYGDAVHVVRLSSGSVVHFDSGTLVTPCSAAHLTVSF